eukprot:TRINITY_DN40151_c0_g1_i1.p1 TRINITY_DN40151_c0_g1~~TRINITY_DN40151_c0_g1_i1.p1  ORF type:complete len:148 (+),score=27.68 TRINITY_DN40151_c0_g1_i1:91-534(+)
MIRRPPRSTLSSSSAASDVYKRQVSTQSTGSSSAPKWSTMHRRDVMHFMRRYEYATNSVISAADASDDLPGFYNWVADRLEMGIMPSAASSNGEGGIRGTNPHWPIPKAMRCDQVTINRYTYDQQQGNSEGEKKRAVSGISLSLIKI